MKRPHYKCIYFFQKSGSVTCEECMKSVNKLYEQIKSETGLDSLGATDKSVQGNVKYNICKM